MGKDERTAGAAETYLVPSSYLSFLAARNMECYIRAVPRRLPLGIGTF